MRPIESGAALQKLLKRCLPGEPIVMPPHIDSVLARHSRLSDQRPATCGAYVLSYLLPARGFTQLEKLELTAEDHMAHLADVTVYDQELAASDEITRRVAAGELTAAQAQTQFPRTWYRLPIRSSSDPSEVGTCPDGMARAVALAGRGRLATVPVPGRDPTGRVQLEGTKWEALLDLICDHVAAGDVDVVFNYDTDLLLAASHPSYNWATLRRPDAAHFIPKDRWGVGHFAALAGIWQGASRERWLVLLNSFKDRGFAGCEPQPAELVRRSVVREDGRGGGVLLIAGRDVAPTLIRNVADLGLESRMWSNGSRPPIDWHWSPGL